VTENLKADLRIWPTPTFSKLLAYYYELSLTQPPAIAGRT